MRGGAINKIVIGELCSWQVDIGLRDEVRARLLADVTLRHREQGRPSNSIPLPSGWFDRPWWISLRDLVVQAFRDVTSDHLAAGRANLRWSAWVHDRSRPVPATSAHGHYPSFLTAVIPLSVVEGDATCMIPPLPASPFWAAAVACPLSPEGILVFPSWVVHVPTVAPGHHERVTVACDVHHVPFEGGGDER